MGESAFYECINLTNITIPDSVTRIEEEVFGGCYSLINVVFENTNGWKVGDIDIFSTDLADTSIASEYLKNTYCWNVWTRES
ncbi:MAG TPA: hypothetical protein DDY82_00675 [Clostridiales bacterium]|nr:hypothetical protein [Clostridiales bacterium]